MYVALVLAAAAALAQNAVTVSPGGIEAIGPKQDDPREMCEPGQGPMATPGRVKPIIVQGGLEAIGPKQDDPRSPVLAIGPKQDDPIKGGVKARPGDDNDPKAAGGSGPAGIRAIGPKQDDPRAPTSRLARPGDDEDPHARACAPAKG
jgi:hypothetical protein